MKQDTTMFRFPTGLFYSPMAFRNLSGTSSLAFAAVRRSKNMHNSLVRGGACLGLFLCC